MTVSRREFLIQGGTVLASASLLAKISTQPLQANPLGRPIGLQLYTVMEPLNKDFDGTLKQVAAIGFREVEMAGFHDKKPAEVKRSLDDAGLHCESVHIFGQTSLQETAEYANGVGAKYVITSLLPPKAAQSTPGKRQDRVAMMKNLTLDDYKQMAEHFNSMGEEAKKAGLQLGYHNHNIEFKPLAGGTGYDELLRSTDPELVKLELDCGWMSSAGQDPAAYIAKYPNRYRLLHIKDFVRTSSPSYGTWPGERPDPTELGRGHVDYKPIFAAAKKAGLEWYYVEQEPPFKDMPVMEAIKVDYEYLHRMS
jgi:sugar phosphate isomerase/epimerase